MSRPANRTPHRHQPVDDKDRRILAFLGRFQADHGYAPSVREICEGTEISSNSVVSLHLEKLASLGCVTWQKGLSRTIHLIKELAP